MNQREAPIQIERDTLDTALDVYWAEYQDAFPRGGDAEDHDHAVRCAVEAVVSFTAQWVTA
jgi:cation transport regulator ChaB